MSYDIVSKPSLFQGIVASFDRLWNDDIYVQFYAFYEELFTSFDLNKAYDKLIEANPMAKDPSQRFNYMCYSSEYIFAMVQTEYDETQCSEEAFKQRAENEIKTRQGTFISRQEKRSKIRRFVKEGLRTKEKYFNEAYRKYFMLDDYPELEKEISFPCKISAMKKWFKNG